MLDRLERNFKRQRDFVSDASHELRTPLTVLRAQVELLDRETDELRRHEATTTLLRRLDELDRLVADMLTLASAEAAARRAPRDRPGRLLRRSPPRPAAVRGARLPTPSHNRHARSRSRPAHPGAAQPGSKRSRPHPGRRSHNDPRTTPREPPRDHGKRHRTRNPPGPARAHLRALSPPRHRPLTRSRRQRTRARHRPRDRRSAPRTHLRRIQPPDTEPASTSNCPATSQRVIRSPTERPRGTASAGGTQQRVCGRALALARPACSRRRPKDRHRRARTAPAGNLALSTSTVYAVGWLRSAVQATGASRMQPWWCRRGPGVSQNEPFLRRVPVEMRALVATVNPCRCANRKQRIDL